MGPDPDAVEDLLAQDAQLRALARRLVTDPDVADDVTQDAWLVAATRKARGAPPPFGWLARVVRNLSLHVGRGEARRARRERAAARDETLPPTDEAVQRVEMRRRLIEAVLALPEPFRSAVILRYFENEPPRRIATRLGVPVETVRSRLKRGHALLRAKLDRDHGHDRRASFAALASLAGLHVPAATAAGAATAATTVAIGGLLMKTKGAVACVIVALLVGTGMVVTRLSSDAPDSAGTRDRVSADSEPGQVASARGETAALAQSAILPKSVREADDEDAAPSTGSVAVRVVWQSDQAPAADLRVRLIYAGSYQNRDAWMFARTDANGTCRFEGVPEGKLSLYASPSGYVQGTECKPGLVAQATIEVPEGNPIRGLVLTPDRVPVPGAEIWLSDDVTAWDGAVVIRSGADGTFTIRGVRRPEERHVGARAPGYGASELARLKWKLVEIQPIELILHPEPATLHGRVIDADGSPVPGATVMIGGPGWEKPNRQEDTNPKRPTFLVTTDARGAFRLEGLAEGEWSLIARARRHPLTRATWSLSGGETREVDVRLSRGATVSGNVVDEAGEPVPRVLVICGARGDWLARSSPTSLDGRFRLEGVEPGTIQLTVYGGDARGNAEATVEARAGESVPVTIVMPTGNAVRGRITDERGAPIPGCWVVLEGWTGGPTGTQGASDFKGVNASREGTFIFPQCKAPEYVLRVQEPDARMDSLRLEHVRPGPETLALTIPKTSRAASFVTGILVDADGVPLSDAIAGLIGPSGGGPNTPTGRDGSFRAGAVQAGTYRLMVQGRPVAIQDPISWIHEGPEFALGVGDTRDLGVIRVLNRLRLELKRADGRPLDEVNAAVWLSGSGAALKLELQGAVATSAPLPAGTHRLEIKGEGIQPVERKFEVKLGEETRLDITLEAAKGR